MNDKTQRRLLQLLERQEKREVGHYMNIDKKVHVSYLWTSHMSKSVTQGCSLPAIGNGQLMNLHTGYIMHPGSSRMSSTRFLPLPVKEAAHQQVKRSTASRHGLDKLPRLPADPSTKEGSLPWNLLDCSNKGGSPPPVHLPPIKCCSNMVAGHQKRDKLPVRLPQIVNDCSIKEGSQSSSSRPWTTGHNHEAGLNNICKLPDLKEAQVKTRPKCGDVHKVPCVLPPILPENPRMDKTQRKRRMM